MKYGHYLVMCWFSGFKTSKPYVQPLEQQLNPSDGEVLGIQGRENSAHVVTMHAFPRRQKGLIAQS